MSHVYECSECGKGIARNARLCPHCGHRFTHPFVKFLAWGLGLMVVAGIIGAAMNEPKAPDAAAAISQAGPAPRAASTGNVAHDVLLTLSKGDQARSLGMAVGEGCVGKRAFYMGISAEHNAFWSVACENGRTYMVEVDADAGGSTKVLDCEVYKFFTKLSCFAKLTN